MELLPAGQQPERKAGRLQQPLVLRPIQEFKPWTPRCSRMTLYSTGLHGAGGFSDYELVWRRRLAYALAEESPGIT